MNEAQNETAAAPKKKKKGCCFGCLMIILVLVAGIIGLFAYYWYQSIPKKSPVEKEYNTIPDYFEN
jgi:flagellar basal body-associated protein FliL